MSKIVSIGVAVPPFCHQQTDILQFMQTVFAMNETEKRKLRFLYGQSGIKQRYSVLPDYSRTVHDWVFYPASENLEPFPGLEQRMAVFNREAPALSIQAIRDCIDGKIEPGEITHLITVSCTGMSAPGLDLQVLEGLELPKNIFRTSVNFMGCYAAIHALRLAHALCTAEPSARVVIVCTELCTLHFQREVNMDNIASSLLFADGSAAVLVTGDDVPLSGLKLTGFYSEVVDKGKKDMAWELSSTGFLMTLSGYVPDLIEADFASIAARSLQSAGSTPDKIDHWCVHPGGKRILEAISSGIDLPKERLQASYKVLEQYGNMSSATILFVLRELMQHYKEGEQFFGAAFGPGLTVETFTATA